jgi:hypothetical protein
MVIEPHKIEFSDIPGFIKESFELMSRKAVTFTILSCATLFFYFIAVQYISVLSFIYAAFPFAMGCLIAKSADNSDSPIISILFTKLSAWKNIFMVFSASLIIFILCAMVLAIIFIGFSNDEKTAEVAEKAYRIFEIGGDLSSDISMVAFCDIYILPGIILLLTYFNAPIRESLRLSSRALMINVNPLLLLTTSLNLISAYLCHKFGFLFFIFMPFCCCLSYVLFRAIYIGRKKNLDSKKSFSLASLFSSNKAPKPMNA